MNGRDRAGGGDADMSRFDDILVPLDGSAVAARAMGCAAWLARCLQARLHVLASGAGAQAADTALERLHVPREHWPLVTLHQAAEETPEAGIGAALERLGVDLVVMSARGGSAPGDADTDPERLVGHVTRHVIETSQRPVVVLPPHYVEHLPWRRILVPVSGETRTDAALALALELAHALSLGVTVTHVVGSDGGQAHMQTLLRYQDAPHHEIRDRVEQVVARAAPMCSAAERATIEDVCLCRGDPAAEFARLIRDRHISLVVLGWHGWFMRGHARVLKALMRDIRCPVLLSRTRAREPFRLKVGEQFQ